MQSGAQQQAPNGQALVVADGAWRPELREALAQIGYAGYVVADPYAAALELVRRPLAFRALLLSLAAVYPQELGLIELVKRRFGHVEVIVTDAAGRSQALAEAIRLGADALLEGQRLHRVSTENPPPARLAEDTSAVAGSMLSAAELKALLRE